ncbi:unnamed protein product [Caenorhabditis angaria]|uniref:Uncharacterized protein n=1 Tax=Caenorhabditis angaria TaxID=860376 RepID=A0A9P1I130_9PELO|nr:unnamed protein product [Caenorhabditis angaria]
MSIAVENDEIACGAVSRTARIIAIDEKSGKLAVVRKQRTPNSHDYIELYNILTGWLATPELVICPDNGSIEHAMFVAGGELMTSHANGSICFIDPHDNRRIKRVQVAASTIWSACDHSTANSEPLSRVALISHSSLLYFYDVISKTILSSISLGVDSRLFDVTSNGELVGVGTIDGVMIAGNGKVQRVLKLDRENRRDPTIAWSVLFWKSDLLACGDSRGTVTLWNPLNGLLIQSIDCMQSHILTMCLVDGDLNIAGVDPRITTIKKLTSGEFNVTRRRNGPIRDVRCLASYDDRIYASGEDFEIYVGKDGCRQLLIQWHKQLQIGGTIIASGGENFVDIYWKQFGEDASAEILQQHHREVFLAKIFAPKQSIITCWNLSTCGQFLAIGTSYDVSIYTIQPETRKKIRKLSTFSTIQPTALQILEEFVYVATGNFEIIKFKLTSTQSAGKTIVEQSDCGAIVKMDISICAKTIAVITSRSQLFIINSETGESRLAKVELPIDLAATANSIYVVGTQPAFSENCDTKKVFFEVGVSNGLVKRSTSSNALKMIPTSKTSLVPGLPVSILKIDQERLILSSYDGHWAILDVVNNSIYNAFEENKQSEVVPTKTTRRIRKNSSISEDIEPIQNNRIVIIRVNGDQQPKTQGFQLRKFGMQ